MELKQELHQETEIDQTDQDEIKSAAIAMGRKGGKSRSAKKIAAVKQNLEKANRKKKGDNK